MTVDDIIDDILKKEGWPKFTNLPNDKGGPTKGGITLNTLSEYRGRPCGINELKFLELAEARDIYETLYVKKTAYNAIRDNNLQALMVDCAVLHGALRATRWLQNAIGAKPDGKVGPMTLAALIKANPAAVYRSVCYDRIEFIGEIITNNYNDRQADMTDKDYSQFALGWLRRALSFLR